jgi:hypothetical protein
MKKISLILCLFLFAGNALAHPPAGAPKGPSRAEPFLKQARDAQKKHDTKAYDAAMLAAKKILAEEGRYSCCINGGCDECAREGNCGCGANLFDKKGVCKTCLAEIKAGKGRYENVESDLLFETPMMPMMSMRGMLGQWGMNREGSGTSWLPDSSPMYGRMGQRGAWQTMQMATLFGARTNTSGKRGTAQTFATSQYMLMGQKTNTRDQRLGLRGMFSLDALTNGKKGYPNLFQTGETANKRPLQDRQHPHDLFMELAALYSTPLKRDNQRAFIYLAPIGEPALGPAAFPHRPSAWDNPGAPISHHWLDGTHITFGVATVGVTQTDKWKLEASAFNGREPDENRYHFDPLQVNSYAGRVTHNPTKDWSVQASYGFLKSPESLEPSVNRHQLTLSATHNKAFESGDNLAAMVAVGQNSPTEVGAGSKPKTTALLLETAYTKQANTYFARLDNTQKDELVGVPSGVYRIQKLSLGGLHTLRRAESGEQAWGGTLDFYQYPAALNPYYGKSPLSLTLFYRWRLGSK